MFDELFVVQIAGNVAADVRDADRMPLAGGFLHLDGLGEQRSFAFDDVEQSKVVFERIEACDIVIVFVLAAPDRPSTLVQLALAGLE